jgi:phage terminase small subunit
MRDKLTQKELKFSIAYASGMNAKESAITAGYKATNASQQGHKLLNGSKSSLVNEEINKRLEDLQLTLGITKQSVLSDLIRLYNQALTAESHGVCKDILKLLGSEIGLFNEAKQVKVEHSHSFEQLLSASTTKDITPANPAIAMD